MTSPLVSVIIPAYNEEQVIEASIARILDSDYANIEIIVADDGSGAVTSRDVTSTGSYVPVAGDWNGDGVATPGRYEAGQWFTTDAAADSPQWLARTSTASAASSTQLRHLTMPSLRE